MAVGNEPKRGEIEPLTAWLAKIIDDIAGKDDGKPLTFGDLRHAKIPSGLEGVMAGMEHRSIDLRAVTTCVTFGRPMELPFQDTHFFAFDPEDWQRFFPAKVIHYLMEEGEKIQAPALRRDGKLPFPVGDAMPVVVAARMSLSFPLLFTMIPLYAVNYHDPAEPLEKVWFSDGGITSNLPIHRFDALFPRWPTLAVNLQYIPKKGKPGRRRIDESLIYMIRRRADGTRDLWNIFHRGDSPLKDLVGFGGAIFESAKSWHDNAYLRLPSYRDRVAEIWLRDDEGGMNLNMPADTIQRLTERGNAAGIKLRDRFAATPPSESLSWDGHRWARLRSALAGLAAYLHEFRQSVDHSMPEDRQLADLLASRKAPSCYEFQSGEQYEAAKAGIEALLDWIAELEAKAVCDGPGEAAERPFCDGPRPSVEIGSRAPM
ncbi:patatin-like phospholipase family protein [Desulforhabdus sp. TSK]|uniref:patatin-like phospholipase family protein n=1 Tax=Desulforhabdus sp. TSK TaxID=2925014 RepID=UPI001FC7DA7C|nr:patatin-like phospholipase family protein [Desulforhabdus sp. TSK]GKT10802.1 hypothetical protein DSTSK_41070 [Desulforhabdus sp. TSK]